MYDHDGNIVLNGRPYPVHRTVDAFMRAALHGPPAVLATSFSTPIGEHRAPLFELTTATSAGGKLDYATLWRASYVCAHCFRFYSHDLLLLRDARRDLGHLVPALSSSPSGENEPFLCRGDRCVACGCSSALWVYGSPDYRPSAP